MTALLLLHSHEGQVLSVVYIEYYRLERDQTMKKALAKWLVGAVLLPAVMLVLQRRINELIDERM